jgi:D-amino-acid dehydrogenase
MLRQVPAMLLDPLGPLAIRPAYLPALLPWLARLVVASRPSQLARSVEALVSLQRLAMPAWDRLAETLGLGPLIHRRGALFAYSDAGALAAARHHFARQRAFDIACDELGQEDVGRLEPGLTPSVVGAAFYPDAAHVADPRQLTEALFATAMNRGIAFERAAVTAIEPRETVLLRRAGAEPHAAEAVVVAAGAWSRPLAAGLGDRVPLDTERGYNVSFPGCHPLGRPVAFPGHGFVVTPLDTGLRIGGAVELAGLDLPPNHRRSAVLYEKARGWVRGLPPYEEGTRWMGFRPSIPDSLPVIGPARASRAILYAFGHGHYGLTQAPATASLVAALFAGRNPAIDLGPFSASRFR